MILLIRLLSCYACLLLPRSAFRLSPGFRSPLRVWAAAAPGLVPRVGLPPPAGTLLPSADDLPHPVGLRRRSGEAEEPTAPAAISAPSGNSPGTSLVSAPPLPREAPFSPRLLPSFAPLLTRTSRRPLSLLSPLLPSLFLLLLLPRYAFPRKGSAATALLCVRFPFLLYCLPFCDASLPSLGALFFRSVAPRLRSPRARAFPAPPDSPSLLPPLSSPAPAASPLPTHPPTPRAAGRQRRTNNINKHILILNHDNNNNSSFSAF